MKYINISKCFIVTNIFQKLSIAKNKVRRVARWFKWLYKFVNISLYFFTAPCRPSVVPELLNLVRSYIPQELYTTLRIIRVKVFEIRCILWKNRILTCITAMEHLDTLGIPVFHKNVMSIDLHLISFAIVVSLIHDSGVIDIFAISGPTIFNLYRRWVRSF